MVTMLHYDSVYNPTLAQQGVLPGTKKPSQKAVVNQAAHLAFLEDHPYESYEDEDLQEVYIYIHLILYSFIINVSPNGAVKIILP